MPLTACKQYCLATGATQGNIAYTQPVRGKFIKIVKKSGVQRPTKKTRRNRKAKKSRNLNFN